MSFDRLAQALAQPGQPEVALKAIQNACQELIGHKLFTILILDHARGLNSRFYTSHPAEYPVGGFKPIDPTREFYEIVVNQGEPRYLRDRETIIRTFPDHPAILGLGCESGVNMPVRWNGRTLGSLNLLHEAGYYGPQHRPVLNVLAGLSIAPFLSIIESQIA
ncbi:GAF domain-containing protein [Roseococcus sp. SYP-B2431]|uniref:GAF domain-containing protein n=1 Tax=Roseococcus sp. SYP-B2431 TaxID=2496640 RepID=UPI00103A3C85|nr:GAF domain-containing protein [Roseococcus sp. SYP-B2431]TCH97552.1 GAF domain-containing protein [Roseococcus sp. SYP-B2431]